MLVVLEYEFLDAPPFKRWSLIYSPWVWDGLSDLLLTNKKEVEVMVCNFRD